MVISTASKITETLDSFTSRPDGIPGVVFRAIKKDGTVLYDGASGVRGLNHKDQPMTNDAVFWIASCTKLLATISALQLVEQGKIALDDPAEKYAPEIAKIPGILTGFDAEEKPILKEPKNKITVRQLLAHTSGLNYDFLNANTHKYSEINKIPTITSEDRRALFCPLGFEPGTDWEYGVGLDWIGIIVENVSGKTLGDYLQQYILEPLGIHTCTFVLSDEQIAGHASVHVRTADRNLVEIDANQAYNAKASKHNGGGGLHSIASDYTTILHTLLNEGEGPNGVRILKKETVDLIFADQTTPLGISMDKLVGTRIPLLSNNITFLPGPKFWALGGLVYNVELPTGRSAGSVAWAGLPNCYWWADRVKGVAGIILTQVLPFYDEEVNKCHAACEQLVYAGLQ